MTLEEAQAEILRLQERNAELETENENYFQKVKELTQDNERVRELNQKYFLKLSAQYTPNHEPQKDEPDAPSCEDFAKSLTI